MSQACSDIPIEAFPADAVLAAIPPRRRLDLIVSAQEDGGQFVIKDPLSGNYYHVGEHEQFLLSLLDGRRTTGGICAAFAEHFAEPLAPADLQEFLQIAEQNGFLELARAARAGAAERESDRGEAGDFRLPAANGRAAKRNVFYLRFSLVDPNRFLDWLAPKIRFFWTRGFLLVSASLIVAAALLTWTNRWELISRFDQTISLRTVIAVWLLVIVVTTLHELAHGLTCKHYGGEVHELGFLLMFFTPAFYCNVSDAWLFPEKSKRLWVGLAGTYWDLCMWAMATFVCRLTVQECLLNYLAWMLIAVCGARSFLNLNPLMKLDGYYVLSDWLGIPNLARRGQECWMATLRWLLCGGPRPPPQPKARMALPYGAASWLFIIGLLTAMFTSLLRFQGSRMGPLGIGVCTFLFLMIIRSQCRGLTAGEVRKMITARRKRTLVWAFAGLALPGLLLGVRIHDLAGGSFQIRPRARAEVRAPETGFLEGIEISDGSRMTMGTALGRIHVPDLESNIARKRAEVREVEANVRMLEAGPRKEDLADQRLRVRRTEAWRDLGKQDLLRTQRALQEDLARSDGMISQLEAEVDYCRHAAAQAENLYNQKALSGEQLLAERKKCQVAELQTQQAKAQKRARQASGTLEAETELAKREKELADVRAALTLLEAGTRPEEIEAQRAKLARLQEELKFLDQMHQRVVLRSPVAGIVTTPRMKDKNGQYFEKGAVICVIEDTGSLEVEIALAEDDEAGLRPGQLVELKARALPFQTFHAAVDRVAPSTMVPEGKVQGTVTVYCHLSGTGAGLLSGMTGYARVYRDKGPAALILANRALRFVRTEFWW
jgi:multidrug resistance efflux pump